MVLDVWLCRCEGIARDRMNPMDATNIKGHEPEFGSNSSTETYCDI